VVLPTVHPINILTKTAINARYVIQLVRNVPVLPLINVPRAIWDGTSSMENVSIKIPVLPNYSTQHASLNVQVIHSKTNLVSVPVSPEPPLIMVNVG